MGLAGEAAKLRSRTSDRRKRGAIFRPPSYSIQVPGDD